MTNPLISTNKLEFLESNNVIPHKLSGRDLKAIAVHYLEKGIKIYIEGQVLDETAPGYSADVKQNAINEMHHIKSGLKDGEYAGYMYLNQARGEDKDHFEAFIIEPTRIIKPLVWNVRPLNALQLDKYPNATATTSLYAIQKINSIPQVGGAECGTLGISYLKKLLQNNAAQLKAYTLCIPYYSGDDLAVHYFFMPSPDALRYSQSTLYNKYIEALLLPHGHQVTHKGQSFDVVSIETHLKTLVIHAHNLNDITTECEAEALLADLPIFAEKWLQRYEVVKSKRELMQNPVFNTYLTYSTQRMKRISATFVQAKTNSGLAVLEEFDKLVANQTPEKEIEVFLKEKSAHLTFKSFLELSYFLRRVGDAYYLKLLDESQRFQIRDTLTLRECYYFLSITQKRGLIDYLKDAKNFNRIILSSYKKISILPILQILAELSIPKEEMSAFLRTHFSRPWLIYELQSGFLLHEILMQLQKVLPGPRALTVFMREYIDMGWLINKLPDYFRNGRLKHLRCMFFNESEFYEFISCHLPQERINTECAKVKNPAQLRAMIENFVELYDAREAHGVLFHKIGLGPLIQLTRLSYQNTLLILAKYSPEAEIRKFLFSHRVLIVERILIEKTLDPIIMSDKLMSALQPVYDFFCPENFDELLPVYKSNLLNNDSQGYILGQISICIPKAQRQTFVEKIFELKRVEILSKFKDEGRITPGLSPAA